LPQGWDREVIKKGAEFLGMDLSEMTTEVIRGMQPVAAQIGLKGNL